MYYLWTQFLGGFDAGDQDRIDAAWKKWTWVIKWQLGLQIVGSLLLAIGSFWAPIRVLLHSIGALGLLIAAVLSTVPGFWYFWRALAVTAGGGFNLLWIAFAGWLQRKGGPWAHFGALQPAPTTLDRIGTVLVTPPLIGIAVVIWRIRASLREFARNWSRDWFFATTWERVWMVARPILVTIALVVVVILIALAIKTIIAKLRGHLAPRPRWKKKKKKKKRFFFF